MPSLMVSIPQQPGKPVLEWQTIMDFNAARVDRGGECADWNP